MSTTLILLLSTSAFADDFDFEWEEEEPSEQPQTTPAQPTPEQSKEAALLEEVQRTITKESFSPEDVQLFLTFVRSYPNAEITPYLKQLLIALKANPVRSTGPNLKNPTIPTPESKTETSSDINLGQNGISVSKTTETVTKLAAPPDKVSLKQFGATFTSVSSSYVDMISVTGMFGVRSLNPKGDFPSNEGGKRNCLDLSFNASVGTLMGDVSGGYFSAIGTVAYTFLKLNPQSFEEIEASAKKQKRNGFGLNLGLGAGIAGGGGNFAPAIAPKIGFEFPKFNYGTASYTSRTIMAFALPIPGGLSLSASYTASF